MTREEIAVLGPEETDKEIQSVLEKISLDDSRRGKVYRAFDVYFVVCNGVI